MTFLEYDFLPIFSNQCYVLTVEWNGNKFYLHEFGYDLELISCFGGVWNVVSIISNDKLQLKGGGPPLSILILGTSENICIGSLSYHFKNYWGID